MREIIGFFQGVIMATIVFIVLAILLFGAGGCSSVRPTSADIGWSHVSHPMLGYPFGPANEEDTLDTLGVRLKWEKGRTIVESGLSYRLRDGGFYGDDFIFDSRFAVKVFGQ